MSRYIITLEIDTRPQDDFRNFQPDTVIGSSPQLVTEWVSGNDREAIYDLLRFMLKDGWMTSEQMKEMARGAILAADDSSQ